MSKMQLENVITKKYKMHSIKYTGKKSNEKH